MSRTLLRLSTRVAAAALVFAAPLSAQQKPPTTPPPVDHGKMDHSKMDHGAKGNAHAASGWPELDAYHMLMMATWHPAKDKNDLAPMRAKGSKMVTAAKALAVSNPPSACQVPAVTRALKTIVAESQKVAALSASSASDSVLKAALKSLHDSFEVLEDGCP